MVEPAELLRKIPEEKKEKTPEERRRELRVIKGGGKKRWGPGAKAGAIIGSSAAVVSGVAAALGETDNLPDPLQGFYDQAFHPNKVAEEVSDQAVRDKYDVEEASEDLTNIVNETQKETPPAVEETPEIIEWEGMIITPIEGLRFDKGTFFAEAGNPYGLEEGEKAGVFVKEAVEINGKMESSIGLRPEVIEVMQKEIMEEDKEFKYPLPFDLEQAKGIKIKEVEFHEAEQHPEENRILDNKDTFLAISNVPLGRIIYAPSSTLMTCTEDIFGVFGGAREFWLDIIPGLFNEEIINDYKIDGGTIVIRLDPKNVEFISQEIGEEFVQWKRIVESDPTIEPPEIKTKMGTPLVKVIDKLNLMECVYEKDPEEEGIWWNVGLKPTDFQIEMYYGFIHVPSGDWENYEGGRTGLGNLMEIGEMKIFILPVYD